MVPIRAPAPIVPLREALKNEGESLSAIPSIFSKYDMDHLHNTYNIPRESFQIFAPSPRIRANDLVPIGDAIIIFEEQLKAGLCFPLVPFFVEVL